MELTSEIFGRNEAMEMHPDGSSPLLSLGAALDNLAKDQAEWSQATFGSDKDRGPIGPLKHLEHEAVEAYEEFEGIFPHHSSSDRIMAKANGCIEIADCFLLVLDAARRAGMTPRDLIDVAQHKMLENHERQWSKPVSDKPVEHIRE